MECAAVADRGKNILYLQGLNTMRGLKREPTFKRERKQAQVEEEAVFRCAWVRVALLAMPPTPDRITFMSDWLRNAPVSATRNYFAHLVLKVVLFSSFIHGRTSSS